MGVKTEEARRYGKPRAVNGDILTSYDKDMLIFTW